MIARPIFVFLLVLNLGAAAWWVLHKPRPPVQMKDAPLPRLEIARDVGKPDVGGVARPVPASSTVIHPATNTACVLLGAYNEAQQVQRALGALRATGVTANAVTRLRSPRGFNVFIPPLASSDAAAVVQERLLTAGFKDQFLIREGAQTNGIALGRYGTEAGARTRLSRLKEAGFQAQLSPAGPATTELWIQAVLKPTTDVNALRGLASAKQAKTGACDE